MQPLKARSLPPFASISQTGSASGSGPKGCASTETYATERVGLLLGQYAKARPHEPAIYIAALAAILSEYPREVIEYVTDPRTGLANSQKWIPEPAEVREACEAQMAPIRRQLQREALQLKNKQSLPPPIDRSSRKSYKEIQNDLAVQGIYIGSGRRLMSIETAASVMAKYGITENEWNSIPNLPPRSTSAKVD